MKRQNFLKRLFAVLLAFCFFVGSAVPVQMSYAQDNAYDDGYENLSPEEKQAYIEQKLKEVNEKLDSLGEQSKETEEYINTLDDKISYLKKELTLSEQEIDDSNAKIESLEQQYKDNEAEIAQLEVDISNLSQKTQELQEEFNNSLNLYYQRLRAIYISGETNIIAMIITSKDISTLLTRLEMIKRVSMADKELLQNVQSESKELDETKSAMQEKQTTLATNQENLLVTEQSLNESISTLQTQQDSYKEKQSAYESEKQESDTLLKQLQDETQTYSEYRNQDQAELEAVNSEIAQAAEEFRKKMEAQTTTAATTTTKPSTTKATTSSEQSGESTTESETTQSTTQTTTQSTTQNSNILQLTYPVPSQTKITCAYGSSGYSGHTGVDFSCASGSAVVAAESGYVLISADLTNSDGSYRSYGRYIVIAHDKTNSAGDYVYTLYAHNSERLVSAGQYVTKGQVIAYSGSTGNSTGPHCHFEVRTPSANYSDCVNPSNYLP